jgi:hypothetical protein
MGKAPYQSPKDHVELQPSARISSKGAASIHSKQGQTSCPKTLCAQFAQGGKARKTKVSFFGP